MPSPIVIEFCERLMDHRYVTVRDEATGKAVQEQRPKYHAQIKDQGGYWAAGDTPDEAIGNLIRSHPEQFGIQAEYLGKLSR